MSTQDDLPTHYVNTSRVLNGPHEIYLTLGLTDPNAKEMKPVFQCVMTGECLKEVLGALSGAYHTYLEMEAHE